MVLSIFIVAIIFCIVGSLATDFDLIVTGGIAIFLGLVFLGTAIVFLFYNNLY